MNWIIRNTAGEIVGHCTGKPGPGNKLPNGDVEIHDPYEEDPADPAYDASKAAEVAAFVAAQDAKFAAPKTTAQKLAALGITAAELKAELAK